MQKGSFRFAWNVPFFQQTCWWISRRAFKKWISWPMFTVGTHMTSGSVPARAVGAVFVSASEHTCVWKASGDSQVKTTKSVLLYIVQYFINSEHSLGIWSDFILCVCVTHSAKGRKKVCRQNGTLSYRCLGLCACKNQDLSASSVNVCARVVLMKHMTQAGCLFQVSFPV